MRSVLGRLIAAAAVTLVGCSLDLTNPNSPTPGQALKDPRTATGQMVVGVLATYRDNRANQIRALGSYGRETYYMFLTDGRFITGPYLEAEHLVRGRHAVGTVRELSECLCGHQGD